MDGSHGSYFWPEPIIYNLQCVRLSAHIAPRTFIINIIYCLRFNERPANPVDDQESWKKMAGRKAW